MAIESKDIGYLGMRILGFMQWFSDRGVIDKEGFIEALKNKHDKGDIETIVSEFIKKDMVIDLPTIGKWLLKHEYNPFSIHNPANKGNSAPTWAIGLPDIYNKKEQNT